MQPEMNAISLHSVCKWDPVQKNVSISIMPWSTLKTRGIKKVDQAKITLNQDWWYSQCWSNDGNYTCANIPQKNIEPQKES